MQYDCTPAIIETFKWMLLIIITLWRTVNGGKRRKRLMQFMLQLAVIFGKLFKTELKYLIQIL